MISVEGLKVEFNATPLFEDVSYVINNKDRIALVGKNGYPFPASVPSAICRR